MAFSSNGELLASTSKDGKVRVWDTKTKELKLKLHSWSKEEEAKSALVKKNSPRLSLQSSPAMATCWHYGPRLDLCENGMRRALISKCDVPDRCFSSE